MGRARRARVWLIHAFTTRHRPQPCITCPFCKIFNLKLSSSWTSVFSINLVSCWRWLCVSLKTKPRPFHKSMFMQVLDTQHQQSAMRTALSNSQPTLRQLQAFQSKSLDNLRHLEAILHNFEQSCLYVPIIFVECDPRNATLSGRLSCHGQRTCSGD